MAEANSNLNIIVKVRDEASAALSRMSNDVSDLGGSLNFAGDKAGILAGALAAIGSTAVLKNAIGAFAEGEAQMAKFDAILKTLPPNLQAMRGEILELADTALVKFGFSNEEAAISMARLLQATRDSDFSMKAFQAAMDLARYKGIGLEEATQALIMAFQGGGRLLKQFGIEVDDHASKETILAAVMAQTAGQAEAYAQTLKGQFDIIGNLFDEFQKGIGGVFAPAIETGIKAITDWIDRNGGLQETIKLMQPLLNSLALFFGSVFVVAVGASVVALLGFIGTAGQIILWIVAIIAALTFFVSFWKNNWDQAEAIFEIFRFNISAIWQNIVNFIRNTFGSAIQWIRDQLNGIIGFFQGVVNTVTNPIQTAAAGISDTYGKVVGALKGVLGFAEGGIVTRPTLAMIGEGGEAEAVIPLSKMRGLGGGVTINIMGDFYTTTEVAERFGNEIARIIKNQLNIPIRA